MATTQTRLLSVPLAAGSRCLGVGPPGGPASALDARRLSLRIRRGAGGELRDREPQEPVVPGLLSAPGLPYELAEHLARRLPSRLRRRFPNVRWSVQARIEPMAAASDQDVDLVEVAHQRLLEEGWKLAVFLTDFPVHVGSHPVTAYASAIHGVGLVSVPALGAVNLEERVEEAVLRLVEGLLGGERRRRQERRQRGALRPRAPPSGGARVAGRPGRRAGGPQRPVRHRGRARQPCAC